MSKAIAVARLHPELTTITIADRLDVSVTTVSQATRRARLAELTDQAEIHSVFCERTEIQKTIISALASTSEYSRDQLAELADCTTSNVSSIQREFAPLVRKLREVGFPDDYDGSSLDRTDESPIGEDDDLLPDGEHSGDSSVAADNIEVPVNVDVDVRTFRKTLTDILMMLDHPEAYTETDIAVMALDRIQTDISAADRATHVDCSTSTVRRARRKAMIARHDGEEEVHAAFHTLDPSKQKLIAAAVTSSSSTSELAEKAGIQPGTASTALTEYRPLIYQLRDLGLPATSNTSSSTPTTDGESNTNSGPYSCLVCGETFETRDQRNGHTAIHAKEDATTTDVTRESSNLVTKPIDEQTTVSQGHEAVELSVVHPSDQQMIPRSDLDNLLQIVEKLHDVASTEYQLSESGSTAAQKAVCDVIIDEIEDILTNL